MVLYLRRAKDNGVFPVLLSIIFIVAIILREWGNGFGLPSRYVMDERCYLPVAMEMLLKKDLNPHYFVSPPLISYTYLIALTVYFMLGKMIGSFSSINNFWALWVRDPTVFVAIARGISGIFGTLTCLIMYRIGKKLFNREIGIASCALLAFSYLHVLESHYAVPDVTALFFMVIAFAYIVDIYYRGAPKDYILAGLFSGLAISTKYSTMAILPSIVIAHVLLRRQKNYKRLIASFVIGILTFLTTCPWIFLDTQNFFSGIFHEYWLVSFLGRGPQPINITNSWFFYGLVLLWGYGFIPLLFSLCGMYFLRVEKTKLFFITITPLIYFCVIGMAKVQGLRYALPLFPYLCLVSACGMSAISCLFGRFNKIAMVVLLILSVAQGAFFSIKHNFVVSKIDTRKIAGDWMQNNLSPHSKIVAERYGPDLRGNRTFEVTWVFKELYWHSVDEYKQRGYQYIITSDFIRMRYFPYPELYPQQVRFYRSLNREGKEIYSISPCKYKGCRLIRLEDEVYSPFWNVLSVDFPGPTIKIYKIADK